MEKIIAFFLLWLAMCLAAAAFGYLVVIVFKDDDVSREFFIRRINNIKKP